MVHEITLQASFVQQLDQIILAGQSGKELLLDMIATASQGDDPAPEGDFDRPPTQPEIIELAKRLSQAKAANNNTESVRLETERRDAAAKKAADDLVINNDDLEELIVEGENALPGIVTTTKWPMTKSILFFLSVVKKSLILFHF